jgi:hypothetical protein
MRWSVVLLAAACQTQAAPEPGLSMTIKPLSNDGHVVALEVREELSGAPADGAPLRLRAPLAVFGVRQIAGQVSGLALTDARGAVPLTVRDDDTSVDGPAYRHWQAARMTVPPLSLRYRIPVQAPEEMGGPPYGMKPAGQGVAGSGLGFLVLPENIASTATRVHWDLSALPPGSFGVITAGSGDTVVAGAPAEMQRQWMLAGPAQVLDSTRTPGFHAYVLGQPPFDATAAMDWADRSYAYLARALPYMGAPEYRLFFRALDVRSFSTGTADGPGALVTLSNTLERQDLDSIRNTIFHEMTHQWVGDFADRSATWFSEGLTTYFSAVLPCEAGLAPAQACADSVNEYAGYYYSSVARNWSQQKIKATDDNENVRRTPYGRGMMYFAQLNAQLLARSNGARDLQAALTPLFAARRQGKPLDQAAWETMLTQELGEDAVTQFRRSVIDGMADIVPPAGAFGRCLERIDTAQGHQWRVIPGCR